MFVKKMMVLMMLLLILNACTASQTVIPEKINVGEGVTGVGVLSENDVIIFANEVTFIQDHVEKPYSELLKNVPFRFTASEDATYNDDQTPHFLLVTDKSDSLKTTLQYANLSTSPHDTCTLDWAKKLFGEKNCKDFASTLE